MAKTGNRYLTVHPWMIIEEGFHPEKSQTSESIFSLANEYQGARGFFEEGYSGESLIGCYLNGVYEERYLREPSAYRGISNRLCFMVNTANWLYTRLELDGERLDLAQSHFCDFRRELDLRSGQLQREFVWETRSGKRLKLIFSRLMSMAIKEVAFQRIAITPLNFSGPITVTLGVDFSKLHRSFQENFWVCPRKEANSILGISKNIHHKLFVGFEIRPLPQGSERLESPQFIGQRFSLYLQQGQETVLEKMNVLYTARDPRHSEKETWLEGQALLERYRDLTYQTALKQNMEDWGGFWERFDIGIEGDPEAQQGIRYCLFQLRQTYRGLIDGANIGAKGLTGEGYNGNVFWDTEIYCLPFYLFHYPPAAKSLLDFRYNTLVQALERARQLDCEGACFPVATIDGTESCTLWQHASLQFQPTTAVAYAIQHYVRVSGDEEFLYSKGVEMLIQICRFLASRGQWSPRRNQFGYYAVMGPDEFHMMVNNNCYTNWMAKKTFEYTLGLLAKMEKVQPQRYASLLQSLHCTPVEIERWRIMAEKMILPRDASTGIYEQHEGFFDLPHIDIDAIPETDFPLYQHWSYDRIYRYDMIKQPDVLMFMFLYRSVFSLDEKQANYDYYEPRCIHESSLSPSIHSIFAAELGRLQEAVALFRFTTRLDLDDYNHNTAEGLHVTSLAASWMNMAYGFGGMCSDSDVLSFQPVLPPAWQGYHFQILYRGSLIRVEVSPQQAWIRVIEGNPVTLKIGGKVQEVDGQGVALPVPSFH